MSVINLAAQKKYTHIELVTKRIFVFGYFLWLKVNYVCDELNIEKTMCLPVTLTLAIFIHIYR